MILERRIMITKEEKRKEEMLGHGLGIIFEYRAVLQY